LDAEVSEQPVDVICQGVPVIEVCRLVDKVVRLYTAVNPVIGSVVYIRKIVRRRNLVKCAIGSVQSKYGAASPAGCLADDGNIM